QNHKGGDREMSAETEPVRLEPGHPITRDLSGGGAQSYLVGLKPGQYVRLAADQRGIDVVLRLLAPDGHPLIEVDSPYGAQGPWRSVGDRGGEALTLHRLGMVQESQKNVDQALDLYGQAIAAYQEVRNPCGEAIVLNRRGALLDARHQTGEALAAYQQALERF